MTVDPQSLIYFEGKMSGTLYGLPDRGFGDGTTDYRPRLEIFRFTITPYYGNGPAGQDQIVFTNTGTVLFTYDNGTFFTGFDAGNTNNPRVPQSALNSLGGGRRALDPEGLVRLNDGTLWISDEYGPALYRFNSHAQLQEAILPPRALLPRQGNFPGKLNFTAIKAPTSGRRNNRGFEGLSITPDGKCLVASLQSPLMQDSGGTNLARNTRVLQFDADSNSPTYGQVLFEHVYPLTLNGTLERNSHTLLSEVLALSSTTFLALEHDSNGLGAITKGAPIYKRIVLFSTIGASNIARSAYDLESGAPGQLSLPAGELPPNLKPVVRKDFIDMLDIAQLARFGLNVNSTHDTNTISEKWEALAALPLGDARNPDDYLLLVGNDNDFKAPITYQNGRPVATNVVSVDTMLLAYRVTLPRAGTPTTANPRLQKF